MSKNEVLSFDWFVSIMAVAFTSSSFKMVTFCDILHEAKQKNKNKLSRVRSTDWKSALKSSIIGHVRYINIQAWLRGFRVKIANFSSFFCPSIPKRDLDTKKTTPNIEV